MSSIRISNSRQALVPNASAPSTTATVGAAAHTLAELGLVIHPATRVLQITVETAAIRECPEGTTPTASLGQPYAIGAVALISSDEARSAKWIRSGGADATLQIAQFS